MDVNRNELIEFFDFIKITKGGYDIRSLNTESLVHQYIESKVTSLTDEEKLKSLGWTCVCESPFELQHIDGSFARGYPAQLLWDELINNYGDHI